MNTKSFSSQCFDEAKNKIMKLVYHHKEDVKVLTQENSIDIYSKILLVAAFFFNRLNNSILLVLKSEYMMQN